MDPDMNTGQPEFTSLFEALRKTDERATAGLLALEMIHEIRNPLEALANLNYLTLQAADNPDQVRVFAGMAEEQMNTLSRIVSQTLGFARSYRVPQAASLAGVAEAALRIHQRTIESKKLHLVKDLPEEITAEIHTGEILQVISNVIVNAIDALPMEGTLSLRLRKRKGELHFLIADNGHGIAKEHAVEIFRPFFTTKEGQGTGLGLSLSKDIIDRHRGKIRLRSSIRPGRSGTIFKISLPA